MESFHRIPEKLVVYFYCPEIKLFSTIQHKGFTIPQVPICLGMDTLPSKQVLVQLGFPSKFHSFMEDKKTKITEMRKRAPKCTLIIVIAMNIEKTLYTRILSFTPSYVTNA